MTEGNILLYMNIHAMVISGRRQCDHTLSESSDNVFSTFPISEHQCLLELRGGSTKESKVYLSTNEFKDNLSRSYCV